MGNGGRRRVFLVLGLVGKISQSIYIMPQVVFGGKLGSGWWDKDEAARDWRLTELSTPAGGRQLESRKSGEISAKRKS